MKKADKLFRELAQLVPEIQQDPSKWKAFLEEFLKSQPHSIINAAFKAKLKKQILEEMREDRIADSEPETSSSAWKWILGLGGSFAILFLLTFSYWKGGQFYPSYPQEPQSENLASGQEGGVQVESLNRDQAFGQLDMSQASQAGNAAESEAAARPAQAPAGMGGGGMDMVADRMFYGERINFVYEYEGIPLQNLPDQTLVYARQQETDPALDQALRPFLGQMDMGVIDLTEFSPLTFRQVSVSEAEEGNEIPYNIYLDFHQGHVGVNPDYEAWQRKYCPSGVCNYQPLTEADLPSDAQIIAWARDFVSRFDISLENTGNPVIQKYWEMYPDESGQIRSPETYPDTVPVIFPHLIDGKPLRESSNQFAGVMVEVNLRERVAVSAQVPVLRLESSQYPARNAEAILELARTGGQYGVQYNNPDRTVTLSLDTPTSELRRIWQYRNGQSQELMMEMLVFPVIKDSAPANRPEGQGGELVPPYYVPQEVLVPLAQTL